MSTKKNNYNENVNDETSTEEETTSEEEETSGAEEEESSEEEEGSSEESSEKSSEESSEESSEDDAPDLQKAEETVKKTTGRGRGRGRGRGSGTKGRGSGTKGRGSGTKGRGSGTKGRGSGTKGRGSGTKGRGTSTGGTKGRGRGRPRKTPVKDTVNQNTSVSQNNPIPQSLLNNITATLNGKPVDLKDLPIDINEILKKYKPPGLPPPPPKPKTIEISYGLVRLADGKIKEQVIELPAPDEGKYILVAKAYDRFGNRKPGLVIIETDDEIETKPPLRETSNRYKQKQREALEKLKTEQIVGGKGGIYDEGLTKEEVQLIVEEYRKMPDDELFATVMDTVKRNKDTLMQQLKENKNFGFGS